MLVNNVNVISNDYYYSFDKRHTSTLYTNMLQLKYTIVSKVTSHTKDEGEKEAKEWQWPT